ncbi:MAG: hypothetical protein Q9209_007171 [Squamulea sp. 1 TL-2023]
MDAATKKDDACELIDYAIESMSGQHITFDRILDFLRPFPQAIRDEFTSRPHLWFNMPALTKVHRTLDIAKLAVIELERRSATYQRNMRHFYEMALPKVYSEFVAGSDAYDELAKRSLWDLHRLVGDTKATIACDKKEVLSDLKRDWRMLGSQEARLYEPLWEVVTGKELMNE